MDILINKAKEVDALTKTLLTSFDVNVSKDRLKLIEDGLKIISDNFDIIFKDVIWKMSAEPTFSLTCDSLPNVLWEAFSMLTSLECRNIGCNLCVYVDGVLMRIVTNKTGNYVTLEAGTSDSYSNLQTISSFIRKRRIHINKDAVDKWSEQKIKLITLANTRLPSSSDVQSLGEFNI